MCPTALPAILTKLCGVSDVSAVIDLASIPLSDAARDLVSRGIVGLETLIAGGDDYEILCTIAEDRVEAFAQAAKRAGVSLSSIGTVIAGSTAPKFIDGQGRGNAEALKLPSASTASERERRRHVDGERVGAEDAGRARCPSRRAGRPSTAGRAGQLTVEPVAPTADLTVGDEGAGVRVLRHQLDHRLARPDIHRGQSVAHDATVVLAHHPEAESADTAAAAETLDTPVGEQGTGVPVASGDLLDLDAIAEPRRAARRPCAPPARRSGAGSHPSGWRRFRPSTWRLRS